ncbi:hypothetical protein KI387_010696, partial [Taxus chinensis]
YSHELDMVVLDEAVSLCNRRVTPTFLGAAKGFMLENPKQQPAAMISQAIGMLQYSRSPF